MIEVIDYGGGNIASLCRALDRLDMPHVRITSGDDLSGSSPLILPGVGAFGSVMEALNARGFSSPVRERVAAGVPFLGVCIGLQVLFSGSEESPGESGLGLIPGSVVRFSSGKIPQIGWNRIEYQADGKPANDYGYFVNSYVAQPEDERVISMTSEYHERFCAGVATGSITAYQFHPEKSGEWGHELIRRWADAC